MIYYPMSVLMNAGIRDILIISTPQDTSRFQNLLGDGHQFGVNLTYVIQPSLDGLAQAFIKKGKPESNCDSWFTILSTLPYMYYFSSLSLDPSLKDWL